MFEIEVTGANNEIFRINLDDFDIICRLCLKKEGTITLFDKKDQKHVGGKFKELLSFLSLLQVDKQDGLPHNICRACASLINEFYLFKEQINTTQVVLHVALGKVDVDKNKMNDVNLKELNTSNDRPEGIKREADISEEIEINDDEITHVKNEQDVSDAEGESLKVESYLNDFVQVIGGVMLEEAEKPKKEPELKTVIKPEGEDSIYKCSLCEETFSERKDFLRHRANERKRAAQNEGRVPCTICGKAIVRDRLDDHMNTHTKNRPHICDICGKGFCSKPNLYTHKVIHRAVKPHVCEICGRGFVQLSSLEDHLRSHNKEYSFMCDICGFSTHTKQSLKQHQRGHRDNKDFYPQAPKARRRRNFYPKSTFCTICKKDFKTGQGLAIHSNTHSGERPFVCKFCGKAFKQPGHVRYHMRLHTGEKPHICELCGKAFAISGNLRQHIKTHTGEKPFNCDICDKAFITGSSLRKHKRIHAKLAKEELINYKEEGLDYKEDSLDYKEQCIVYSDTEYTSE